MARKNLWKLLGLSATLGLLLAACTGTIQTSPTPAAPTAVPATETSLPQPAGGTYAPLVNEGGAVTVQIEPLNLGQAGEPLEFAVSMNTHSVDLSFDLAQLAALRTEAGEEVAAASWDGQSGGHHVSGTLVFPAVDLSAARSVEIIIRDVAGISERAFRWDLQ